MHYLGLFFKGFSKHILKPLRVCTRNTIGHENPVKILKVFNENSIEKWNFTYSWEKLFLKLEPSK